MEKKKESKDVVDESLKYKCSFNPSIFSFKKQKMWTIETRENVKHYNDIKKHDKILVWDTEENGCIGIIRVEEKIPNNTIIYRKIQEFENPIKLDKAPQNNIEGLNKNEKEIISKNKIIIVKDNKVEDEIEKRRKQKNIIFYGAPGTGKSYIADLEAKDVTIGAQNRENNIKRVLFYPEYSYSDFIGQRLPQTIKEDGKSELEYKFEPGPFTRILKEAILEKEKNGDNAENFCLIVDEINRGNAAAIFGDIFQLLDRNYSITNKDISEEIWGKDSNKEIYLPDNLYIYATMNTSDQNVFVLDTAFKRRWNMQYVQVDFNGVSYANTKIPNENKNCTWQKFVETLNEIIPTLNNGLNGDDKLIGQRFVSEYELNDIDLFANKIFLYLWNDVAKTNKEELFQKEVSYNENKLILNTLNNLIDAYKKVGLSVFADGIFDEYKTKATKKHRSF